jgi:hypothetical protein
MRQRAIRRDYPYEHTFLAELLSPVVRECQNQFVRYQLLYLSNMFVSCDYLTSSIVSTFTVKESPQKSSGFGHPSYTAVGLYCIKYN